MSVKKEWFQRYSKSDVYLEEHNHVYVHKETGMLYNSVTTALSLLKSDFNKDEVITAIIKQYQNFIKWYRTNSGREENMHELLYDYVMYSKKRPFSVFNDKKIFKALSKYSSIEELASELTAIKKKDVETQLKACYLKTDNTVMTKEEISSIWDATNMLSRHYGHMIHESIELYLLEVQGAPIDRLKKIKSIQEKYNDLQSLLASIDINHNQAFFDLYKIDLSAIEFMEWMVNNFKKVNPYQGHVIIPEKVNFSSTYEICGTTDVEKILSEFEFEIEDHKTNKSFSFVNEYGKTLAEPFDDMQETSFNTYTLQLNTYGLIQEMETGRQFKGARITYYDRQLRKFELIELPVMLDKAKLMLENFKQFQDQNKEKFLMSGIFNGVDKRFHNVLSKWLYEDIEKRKNSGKIDMEDKAANRLHYQNFVNTSVQKLSEHL